MVFSSFVPYRNKNRLNIFFLNSVTLPPFLHKMALFVYLFFVFERGRERERESSHVQEQERDRGREGERILSRAQSHDLETMT